MTSRAGGFTLIELVVFVSMIGIALGGVLVAYDYAARDSADPIVKKQALAIAESLLEEVQQMPFTVCDPDDPAVFDPATPCAMAEATGPEAGESRYSATTPFDNVNDYHGYDTALEAPPGIKDVTGAPIAGLRAYNARVTVGNAALPGIPAGEALLITVDVTGPYNVSARIEGYRTRHAPQL
ncbi:MAG TPA: type II secretion system protein [Burkholderiales bacterium]|nr:type II secretion system protein [Burkholderiales bacterium]